MSYGDSSGELQCLNAEDYPQIKELNNAQSFVIIRSELRDLVNKVAFSVATDDARPMLKGVLLEVDDVSLTGVALDGYRLAKCVKPLKRQPLRCVRSFPQDV
ncbi:MAG: hypothetical protein ACLUSP_02470 [Christensenellales bacterium]